MANSVSILQELPYPLMPQANSRNEQLMRMHLLPPEQTKFSEGNFSDEVIQKAQEKLIDIEQIARSTGEQERLIKDHQLQHIYKNIYTLPHVTLTPLLKAQAIQSAEPVLAKRNQRISRLTAAWIWGYLQQRPPLLYVDFERRCRINRTTPGREHMRFRQVHFTPFDYVQLDNLYIATPRKIALDLLTIGEGILEYSEEKLLEDILADGPHNGCRPSTLLYVLKETKYIRNREMAQQWLRDFEDKQNQFTTAELPSDNARSIEL